MAQNKQKEYRTPSDSDHFSKDEEPEDGTAGTAAKKAKTSEGKFGHQSSSTWHAYASRIKEKVERGELDERVVDSLELQILVDGCKVPIGQDTVEEVAVAPEEDPHLTNIERYMLRPARVQVKEHESNAYVQGNEDYNIWYNKWSGERNNTVNGRASLTPAMYKCDPDRDSGYTRGSTKHSIDECGTKYCCLFFAKGCCSQGENCLYLHRLPTIEDEFYLDSGVDIFGRERHAKHRDDMSGVGSFMSECKSLFVGDVYPDNTEYNPVDNLKKVLLDEFGKFGRVTEINLVPAKGVAFISYECRVIAEFAKVAMASQPLDKYSVALNVKWAHDMKKENRKKGHDRAAFEQLVRRHEQQLQVFQEQFLKNNNFLNPKPAESKEELKKKENERIEKLHSILQASADLDENTFNVEV